jgi:hypothetical protein
MAGSGPKATFWVKLQEKRWVKGFQTKRSEMNLKLGERLRRVSFRFDSRQNSYLTCNTITT